MMEEFIKSKAGFSIIELVIIVAIIGILSIIAIPSYNSLRIRAYNATANSSGKQAAIAQGTYDSVHDLYAPDLDTLLTVDRNLTDAISVTFIWVGVSDSGYTINVTHESGNKWYTYQDD